MDSVQSGLVEIVREFLLVHELLQRLFGHFREGSLRFEEVEELVGDSQNSALYRLKERCHALFRADKSQSESFMRREALFDLAVGSLFHEAMKFRENLYQLEVYAPRVRQLQREDGDEGRELFGEFDKILDAAGLRLEESLSETEALLEQTSKQLKLLLLGQRDNGLIARYLVEKRSLTEKVFGGGLDGLLAEVHGEAAEGFAAAAKSYLDGSHFGPALSALREARLRRPDRPELERLESYALGMQAFLAGDYQPTLERLNDWLESGPSDEERSYVPIARAALLHIDGLQSAEAPDQTRFTASELMQRLALLTPEPG